MRGRQAGRKCTEAEMLKRKQRNRTALRFGWRLVETELQERVRVGFREVRCVKATRTKKKVGWKLRNELHAKSFDWTL